MLWNIKSSFNRLFLKMLYSLLYNVLAMLAWSRHPLCLLTQDQHISNPPLEHQSDGYVACVCHDAEPCLQAKNLKQHEILVNTWLAYLCGRGSLKFKFFYIQGQLITSQTGKCNFYFNYIHDIAFTVWNNTVYIQKWYLSNKTAKAKTKAGHNGGPICGSNTNNYSNKRPINWSTSDLPRYYWSKQNWSGGNNNFSYICCVW